MPIKHKFLVEFILASRRDRGKKNSIIGVASIAMVVVLEKRDQGEEDRDCHNLKRTRQRRQRCGGES